jgi:type I restriction enzyme S subunit
MLASKKQPKTPQLRFPQFSGEWEKEKLGDFAEISTGSSNKKDADKAGKYAFFDRSVDTMRSSQFLFDDKAIIVPGEGVSFEPRYHEGKFDLHQRAYAILSSESEVNWQFLFYTISTSQKYFKRMAVGSTMPSLRMPVFEKMKLRIPEVEEQKKIADFLSSVDGWVENLKANKEKLEKYKSGLMQKLFPTKGGSEPQLRFPQFSGEWEEKSVSEFVELSTSKYIKEEKDLENGYLLADMGSVTRQGKLETEKMTSKAENVLKKDEMVMPNRDIGNGEIIGSVALVDQNDKYVLGGNMYKVQVVDGNLAKFVYFLINSTTVNNEMRRRASGTSQLQLNQKDIKGVTARIPELEEQKKIAEFLSEIDTLIDKRQEEIDRAQEWKRGLMQKMFV